jgi:hypothetical protein
VKIVSKVVSASALALSAVAPQFAQAAYLENPTQLSSTSRRAQHVMSNHVWPRRAIDSNAYAPAEASASAPAGIDSGIGSQR